MKNFLKITVHFALCGFVGSESDFSKNAPAELAKNFFVRSREYRAGKPLSNVSLWEKREKIRRRVGRNRFCGTKGIESSPIQRRTAVSKSKFLPQCQNSLICSFCPCGKLVGECLPQTLLLWLTPLIPPQPCGNRKEVIPCERNTTRPTAAG